MKRSSASQLACWAQADRGAINGRGGVADCVPIGLLLKILCPLHLSNIRKFAKFQQIQDTFYILNEISWNSKKISSKSVLKMTKLSKKCKILRIFLEISSTFLMKISENFELGAVQRHRKIVDLVKSFPTSINLQKSASVQPRTSLYKLAQKFQKWAEWDTIFVPPAPVVVDKILGRRGLKTLSWV